MTLLFTATYAQKKQKPVTGYAVTAAEKGGRNWKEVRLVNIHTGEEVKKIYSSKDELETLNARTGKPTVKKAIKRSTPSTTGTTTELKEVEVKGYLAPKKIVNLDVELEKAHGNNNTNVNVRIVQGSQIKELRINRNIIIRSVGESSDKPFATNSAACAFDKKHDRLYYTPMGINQLRYIDLKSKTPKVYYFEDEAFGQVAGSYDAPNQITRMTFASDGNGYALSNDGKHLIRFTTGKKAVITDLGTLTDDASNSFSIHNKAGYGGDMVADADENLYLVTAQRHVFFISIDSRVAKYLGTIKGLPKGFSTNGAMVEEGSKVIVASSESTAGYYRFDLNTLQAEKISTSTDVFNAADLANGNLASKKKKDEVEEETVVVEEIKDELVSKVEVPIQETNANDIGLYPNPVTDGRVKLSFNGHPSGKYQVQLLDLSGRLITASEVNVLGKNQVIDFNIPDVAKGNYFVRISSEANKVMVVKKIIVASAAKAF
jgi:hypothetical protein